MTYLETLKDRLIKDLWVPSVKAASDFLQPRLRKNKHLTILTLTSSVNCREIQWLVERNLTTFEEITAWTYSHHQILALNAEAPIHVIGGRRFEDSLFKQNYNDLSDPLCYHVVNLDFVSQNPIDSTRPTCLIRELITIENIIRKFRDCHDLRGLVVLYTTCLTREKIDIGTLKKESDNLQKTGWRGLKLNQIPKRDTKKGLDYNLSCIRSMLKELVKKYELDTASADYLELFQNQKTIIYSKSIFFKK